jgi:hypothetical protein
LGIALVAVIRVFGHRKTCIRGLHNAMCFDIIKKLLDIFTLRRIRLKKQLRDLPSVPLFHLIFRACGLQGCPATADGRATE